MTRAEKQQQVFDAIVTVASQVPTVGKVIADRPLQDSDHDLKDIGIQVDETGAIVNQDGFFELAYLLIEFDSYEDRDSGVQACPRFFLDYSLHLFRLQRNDRKATKDFNRAVLDLGEKFLDKDVLKNNGAPDTFNERLVVSSAADHGAPDSITRRNGHSIDFTLRVEAGCNCTPGV